MTEYEEIVGYHLEQAFRYRAELGPIDHSERALDARRRTASAPPAAAHSSTRCTRRREPPLPRGRLLPPDSPCASTCARRPRRPGLADLTWADRVLTEAAEATAARDDWKN